MRSVSEKFGELALSRETFSFARGLRVVIINSNKTTSIVTLSLELNSRGSPLLNTVML